MFEGYEDKDRWRARVSAPRRDRDERKFLKTDYDFRVTDEGEKLLWYVPNEVGGVTIMKPEDC